MSSKEDKNSSKTASDVVLCVNFIKSCQHKLRDNTAASTSRVYFQMSLFRCTLLHMLDAC